MNIEAKDALWDFVIRLYQREPVAAQCLWLQDTYEVNVNVLLWGVWCGVHHIKLEALQLKSAETSISDWHQQVVLPLRRARRYIKATARPSANECRAQIKAAELLAERQVLEDLAHLSTSWPKGAVCCWRENVAFYLQQRQVPNNARDEALSILGIAILAT